MTARIVKTMTPDGPTGYFHHEHRSKKGRKYNRSKKFLIERKKKIEAIRLKEIENG